MSMGSHRDDCRVVKTGLKYRLTSTHLCVRNQLGGRSTDRHTIKDGYAGSGRLLLIIG